MLVSVVERSIGQDNQTLCRYEDAWLQLVHSGLGHYQSPCLKKEIALLLRHIAERLFEFNDSRRQKHKADRG